MVVFSGEGWRVPNMSLALEHPRLAPVQSWSYPRARDIFGGLSGPRLNRLLAPSLVDFQGNPGIQDLHQAMIFFLNLNVMISKRRVNNKHLRLNKFF